MPAHHYRVVVEGELGPRYASAFDGMALCARDGKTEITGPIIDPSHLHGVLERISALGLTLHSLTPLDGEDTQAGAPAHTPPVGIEHEPGANQKGPT